MSSLPSEIAGTIQAGHIARHPDPLFDNAPATAADTREPISIHNLRQHQTNHSEYKGQDIDVDIEEDDDDDDTDVPYSVLRPASRTQGLPPLPDLRFEQSYLHSISKADKWWKVALITLRDQVCCPLAAASIYLKAQG